MLQDAYLLWVCYAILFFCATFCAVGLPLGTPSTGDGSLRLETRKVMAEGTWQVVFVVFLAYAMMPLKTWVATLFGLILPIVHLAVSTTFATEFPNLLWQQVILYLIIYVYVNRLATLGEIMLKKKNRGVLDYIRGVIYIRL